MKNYFWLILFLYAFGNIKASPPKFAKKGKPHFFQFAMKSDPPNGDSCYYWNPDTTKEWYHYQRDVAVFRYDEGAAYTGTLPAWVTSIKHLSEDPHGYNVITFDTSATDFQIDVETAYLAGDVLFEYGFIPVTKDRYASAEENLWLMGSDYIQVLFKNPVDGVISEEDIEDFRVRNNLSYYEVPSTSLPGGAIWAYMFKLNGEDRFTPFDACARIWEAENAIVSHVEPDMYKYKSSTCVLPNEFTNWAGTAYVDALWHILNTGSNIYYASGTSDADADICECWGDGYHGDGVKVAVIDDGGFDFSHPDMVGQFLSGWDCINNVAFTTTKFANADEHGMRVASVIAAIEDAGQTPGQPSNTSVVGVAYKSKILPYIASASSTEKIMALQKAVVDGADIINCSWSYKDDGFGTQQSVFINQINAAINTGRSGKGCIVVGSTGNENQDAKYWPAADAKVIGVGATDPHDFRGSYQQTQPWSWVNVPNAKGSNYLWLPTSNGVRYDVVAPGTDIRNAYTENPTTTPAHKSSSGTGTSFAAPIVAGIAAIILEKYPTFTYQQVTGAICSNADKIRSGTGTGQYNYSQFGTTPGYAYETFYGRVNCYQAISSPMVGLRVSEQLNPGINLAYQNKNEVSIVFDNNSNQNGFNLGIYDVTGKQVGSTTIEANATSYRINTENYAKGVYLFKVSNQKENVGKTFKYIK